MPAPTSTTFSNINAVGFTAGSEGITSSGPITAAGGVVSSGGFTTMAGGSAITLTAADAGKVVLLDTAAGTTVTLPTATGSFKTYRFCTTVIATSNSHIVKVPNATTYFNGALQVVDDADGTCTSFGTTGATTTRSDTITLNRGTTGSVAVGEWIEITDVAANNFSVRGVVIATGFEANPFSATV